MGNQKIPVKEAAEAVRMAFEHWNSEIDNGKNLFKISLDKCGGKVSVESFMRLGRTQPYFEEYGLGIRVINEGATQKQRLDYEIEMSKHKFDKDKNGQEEAEKA